MAARVTLTPGTTWTVSSNVTDAKLNLTGNPGIQVLINTREVDDISTTVPTEGQMLIYRVGTGKWTPEAIPVSSSDTFNRVFAWEHFS